MSLNQAMLHYADGDSLADALAGAVAENLRAAIAARGHAVLAVSGGTTPERFLHRLGEQSVEWLRVTVTLVDERWVAPTSGRSNARLVRDALLRGAAARARFVPLYTGTPDPEAGCGEVAQRVAALPLPLDVAVLGLGLDGHTASWFPDGDRLAQALDPHGAATVLPMRAPGAGEPRITLTLPVLATARALYLHIEGPEKKRVFESIVRGDGALAESGLRALMQHAPRAPLSVYWCA
jgi:6-phosphogluconolactonase